MEGDNKPEHPISPRSEANESSFTDNDASSTVYDKMIKLLDEMDEDNFRYKVSQAMEKVDRKKRGVGRKWITVVGLILSVVGTAVIWVDSQAVINGMSEVAVQILESAGVWEDVWLHPGGIDEVQQSLGTASSLKMRGFVLLILGFVVQGVGVVRVKVVKN